VFLSIHSQPDEFAKEKIDEASFAFPRRRGSIKPRIAVTEAMAENPKGGKLYIRIAEMKHKLKSAASDAVFCAVVSVQKCSLATVPVKYSDSVTFEEGFLL